MSKKINNNSIFSLVQSSSRVSTIRAESNLNSSMVEQIRIKQTNFKFLTDFKQITMLFCQSYKWLHSYGEWLTSRPPRIKINWGYSNCFSGTHKSVKRDRIYCRIEMNCGYTANSKSKQQFSPPGITCIPRDTNHVLHYSYSFFFFFSFFLNSHFLPRLYSKLVPPPLHLLLIGILR